MSTPSVDALLSRWLDLQANGQHIAPDEFCRDCPDLLPEFLRQLDAAASADVKVREAATPVPTATVPQTTFPDTRGRAWPDVVVPGYEILEELGRGGMGVVYKARQLTFDRVVALKVILAGGHASRETRDRFLAEGRAVAALQHPNIVQIFDGGEHGGLPHFSLEFVGGGTLADRLAGGPLPPREAATLVATLARAVQYAHDQGVVHRDLKPLNVLLTADGTPKVADFGLAKWAAAVGPTQTGMVMGSPGYMAPEQAEGNARDAGPAADIHAALGAILYTVLCGRPPYRGGTSLEVIRKTVSEEPEPPSRVTAGVPRELEAVCLRCLRKPPADRYPTAAALAHDLQRFLDGETVVVPPRLPFADR